MFSVALYLDSYIGDHNSSNTPISGVTDSDTERKHSDSPIYEFLYNDILSKADSAHARQLKFVA